MNISNIFRKRMIGDIKLLKSEPHPLFDAIPDEKNALLWYFVVKGHPESDYKEGFYIGEIRHDPEYPFKPPDFKMLTPSGRFLADQKICLSNSSYHSNEWSAMWNIKTIIIGFISIMLDDKEHGISHIHDYESRKVLAQNSVEYNKTNYLDIVRKFTRFFDTQGNPLTEISKNGVLPKPNKIANSDPHEIKSVASSVKPSVSKNKQDSGEKEIESFDINGIEVIDESKIMEKYDRIIKKLK